MFQVFNDSVIMSIAKLKGIFRKDEIKLIKFNTDNR